MSNSEELEALKARFEEIKKMGPENVSMEELDTLSKKLDNFNNKISLNITDSIFTILTHMYNMVKDHNKQLAKIEEDIKRIDPDIHDPILIYYHEEYPGLLKLEKHGNFIDVRAAEDITLKKEESIYIPLGLSVNLPDNYYASLLPRSSTFKKFGILVANSMGIIDDDYRSMKDEWKLSVYATRDTFIPKNERIAQFTITRECNFTYKEGKWEAPERKGFGSSDNK